LNTIKLQIIKNPEFGSKNKLNKEGIKLYNQFKDFLFSKEKRANFSQEAKFNSHPELKAQMLQTIKAYELLPEAGLIDRAFRVIWNFSHMTHDEFEMQLSEG